jgi:hypothetical protein
MRMNTFFVPAAESAEQAERVYKAIADFVHAPIYEDKKKRVRSLSWIHNGMEMNAEVGKPLPSYYGTFEEPVIAIYECSDLFKICTTNRGGIRGEPIYAGKGYRSYPTYFEC